MNMKILVGCDPELFVKNPNSGKYVSGHGLILGTKYEPFKVDKGAVQVDGMALEFNIDPAATGDEFINNINAVRQQLQSMVPGFTLCPDPVADFDEEVIKAQPEEALELGCEPDYCAWTNDVNPRPNGAVNFRSGAGHIHIGWGSGFDTRSTNHRDDCLDVVKQMDYYLGIHSLLWDPDNRRRSLYGKAGAFRVKPYGVEYRTLSNAWLKSDLLMKWVYAATRQAMQDLMDGRRAFERHGDLARSIIDNNETDWPSKYDIDLPVSRPPMAA